MNNDQGNLSFMARLDNSRLISEAEASKRALRSIGETGEKQGSRLENAFGKAGKSADDFQKKTINAGNAMASIGAMVSLSLLAGFAKEIANIRGEWQKYEAVLTNTLGSNQDAKDSLKMIGDYGAKTNFQVNELTDSFVKLASQGFKPTRDEMASLGDLAASKAKGFDQLTEAIIDAETFEFERLKEFGIRASKNGDQITLTFKGVKTTVDATAESVRNYILSLGQLEGVKGSTDAISKTILGLASNFEDAVNQMMNSIGESQEGLIAGSIQTATTLVNNYESIIKVIEALVISYGAYKAASIAVSVVEAYRAEMMVTKMILTTTGLHEATVKLTFAQWASAKAQGALNVVTSANPYVLAATAIAGLVSMLVLFSDSADEAAEAQAKINDEVNDQKAKIETLTTIIKSETTANADRAKALKELNDLMPNHIGFLDAQTLSTQKGKEAIDEYIKSIRKKAEMEQLTADLKKNLDEQDRIARGDLTSWEKFKGGQGPVNIQTGRQDYGAYQSSLIYTLKEQEDAIKSKMEATMAGKKVDEDAGKSAKTIAQQLLDIKNNLVDAEVKLNELRQKDSKATPEEIQKQEGLVKRLQEQQEILTGIKQTEKKNVDQLKAAQEALQNAVKSGDQAAIKAAASKVTLLEKEEKKIKDIMDLELQRAWRTQFDGQAMKPISSIGTKPILQVGSQKTVQGILYEVTAIDKTGPVWKKIAAESGKINKQAKDNAEKAAKEQEKLDDENFEKKKDHQKQLLEGAVRFTNELITQLDISEKQKESLSEMVDVAADLASGNYIAAAFSFATAMIPDVFTEQERLQQAAQSVLDLYKLQNFELERQLDILGQSTGANRVNEEKKTLALIETQKKELEAAARVLQVDASKTESSGLFGWGSTKTTMSFTEHSEYDTIEKWKDTLEGLKRLTTQGWTVSGADDIIALINEYEALSEQRQALLEELTGTTSSSITDVIADGFANGKDSIADFANDFESMMKAAVLNVFKTQYLANASKGFFDQFAALSENGLTGAEIGDLRSSWSELLAESKTKMDEFSKISGLDFSEANDLSRTGSSKGFAAMSQDTGDELNGRFTAIQGHTFRMADTLDILKANSSSILNNVIEIKGHTESMQGGIQRMEGTLNSVKQGIETINLKGITLK